MGSCCHHCHAGRVNSREELLRLWEKVREELQTHCLFDISGLSVHVGLTSAEQIKKVCDLYHKDCDSTLFVPRRKEGEKKTYGILVKFGLPLEVAETELVHEAMHAWISKNRLANLSPTVVEGMAQFAVHKYLIRHGCDPEALKSDTVYRLRQMQFNPNPIFSAGLNAALDASQLISAHTTIPELCSWVKRLGWFPDASDLGHRLSVPTPAKNDLLQDEQVGRRRCYSGRESGSNAASPVSIQQRFMFEVCSSSSSVDEPLPPPPRYPFSSPRRG